MSSLIPEDNDNLFDSFLSNLRFLTIGNPELDLLLKTGSEATTTDSVKFEVVNFLLKVSLIGALDVTGPEPVSIEKKL